MPSPFPHHYEVELLAGGHATGMITASGRPFILGAAPPEFDGPPGHWGPEHLLLSSVALCLMTTYQALAGRARLPMVRYASRAEGILDKTAAGLAFTSIVVQVDLGVEADQIERAERLMESAQRHCIVSNALRVPVIVQARVHARDSVAV